MGNECISGTSGACPSPSVRSLSLSSDIGTDSQGRSTLDQTRKQRSPSRTGDTGRGVWGPSTSREPGKTIFTIQYAEFGFRICRNWTRAHSIRVALMPHVHGHRAHKVGGNCFDILRCVSPSRFIRYSGSSACRLCVRKQRVSRRGVVLGVWRVLWYTDFRSTSIACSLPWRMH